MNTFKIAVLLVALTVLFIWVGNLLGGRNGMIFAFSFALIMNFATYWFSDKLVLFMARAKPLAEKDAPEVYRIVRSLTQRSNMPMPKIYIMNTEVPNAFATGRSPAHAAVCVTKGIMQALSTEELEGVLSHELSHIKNRDTLVATIVASIAGAIFMLARIAQFTLIFGGRRRDKGVVGLVAMVVTIIVAPLAAILIQLAVSRAAEYRADKSGALMSHKPHALANALRRIHAAAQRTPLNVNPTTAHMYIINPFSGKSLMNLFSTHPPMEERVKRLEALAKTAQL
ncbi:MAG: zinc metalloprotease HtpX [Candidatus Omnitrophota bacterium]